MRPWDKKTPRPLVGRGVCVLECLSLNREISTYLNGLDANDLEFDLVGTHGTVIVHAALGWHLYAAHAAAGRTAS